MEVDSIENFDGTNQPVVIATAMWQLISGSVSDCENMNSITPDATSFLTALPPTYLLALVIASVLCITTLSIGMLHYMYIISYVTHPYRRVFILYLAGTAPFVSSFALMSMFFPRTWFLAHLLSFLYFSIGLYFVICLLIHIVEGRNSAALEMDQKPCELTFGAPPFCCLRSCLPPMKVESKNLRIIEYTVVQTPCVRLVATIMSLLLFFEFTDQAYVYLKTLDLIILPSLLCGIYGCRILINTVSRLDDLIPYRYIVVFRLLDVYLLLFGIQQPFFDVLALAGAFDCGHGLLNALDTAFFWKNFVTVIESFCVILISTALLKPSKAKLFDNHPLTQKCSVSPMFSNERNYK